MSATTTAPGDMVAARGKNLSTGHRRADRLVRLGTVVVPSGLALYLALIDISRRSIWLDESATVSIASQHGRALGAAVARDGGNMLAYYGLIHVLIGWFGDSTLVLRLPSALAMTATVALVVCIGERLFERRTAFAAGLICATSLPLVYWAQDARSYAMVTTFVSASFYFFLFLVARPPGSRLWSISLLAYVVATTLAMYCSYIAALEIAVQLLALTLYRDAARRVLVGLCVAAACCAPLAVLALARGTGQLSWLGPPTPTSAYQLLELVTSSGLQPNFSLSSTGVVLGPLTVALVVVALGFTVVRVRRHGLTSQRAEMLVLAWILVPIALATVESELAQSIFTGRNVIGVLPAVALCLAALLVRAPVPAVLGWAGLFALLALRCVPLAPTYGVSPEPWKAATAYLLAEAEPGDCVAFYPLDTRMAVDYYVGTTPAAARGAPRPVWPSAPFTAIEPFVERYPLPTLSRLVSIHASCKRLWLISSHDGQKIGSRASEAHYQDFLEFEARISQLYSFHQVHIFGWASLVRVQVFTNIPRTNYGRSAIPT